ncbi:MAG: DNA gyrase C-terminal beta-propeller domain-containing protein [bacterium]|nr:DNA gyrase C-terminal beta-propeller domain-containing protein [bacterium]
MGLAKGEQIIKVLPIKKDDQIGVISERGRILIFDPKQQLRPMGKTAAGVKVMELQPGDQVADIFAYQGEPFIFVHDDQNGKLVSVEDIFIQKRGPMRRAQPGVICGYPKASHPYRGAIAIIEGAVNLLMENGRVDLYDSTTMELKLPEDELTKITNGKIVKMRRPRGEKEEKKDEEGKGVTEEKGE